MNGLVYVGDSQGDHIFGLNASTGRIVQAIKIGWTPVELAWDSSDNTILVGTYSGLVQVDPTNSSILRSIRGDTSPAVEGSSGLAYDPDNGFAYSVDFVDNLVLVVNVSAGTFVSNISVGLGPQALTYDSIDHLLFVGNSEYSSVTVIDTLTNTIVVSQIKLGGTPGYGNSYPYPNCLAYDPQNGYVYVGNMNTRNTTLVDAATRSLVSGSNLSTGDCLSMLYDPSNGHVYVGSFAGSIADIVGTTLAGATIADPESPTGFAFDARDNLVCAANVGDTSVTLFNASTEVVLQADVHLSESFLRATYDPVGRETYVATDDLRSLAVVNSGSAPSLVAEIPVGSFPEASVVATRSDYLFVANAGSNNVSIIDGATDRVLNPGISVGQYPIALGYDSLHDQVWVANGYSANVTVLNGSTGTVVAPNLTVGQQPDGIAFDPVNGWMFVANFGSSNVTIINSSTERVVDWGVPVGAYPEDILYDARDGTIVVANSGSANLTILDGSTGAIVDAGIAAGSGPVAMALDTTRDRLYVADAAGGAVSVVNLTTDTTEGTPILVNSDPQGVAYDPVSDQVDVSDFATGTVSILATVPIVSSLTVVPSSARVGDGVVLVAHSSEDGGAALNYSYSGLPPGCASASTDTLLCAPAVAGSYRITVTATDPRGYEGWRTVPLDVLPALANATLSIHPGAIDLGQAIEIVASGTTPVPPLSFAYSGLPPGCTSVNASQLTCTPASTGDFAITVEVTDADGGSAFAASTLAVTSDPVIASVLATPSSVTLGGTVTLATLTSGGAVPYTFGYSGLPPGCTSGNTSLLVCSPTAEGNYSIGVTVTDSAGVAATGATRFTVVPVVVTPLRIAAFWARPSVVNYGSSVNLTTLAEGSMGEIYYAYSGLPAGCISGSTISLVCTPDELGSYTVTVTATDAMGRTANASTEFSVVPIPTAPGPTDGAYGGLSGPALLVVGSVAGLAIGLVSAVAVLRMRVAGKTGGKGAA